MLKKAGFKKREMKKPDTAMQIYQYLITNPDFEQDMLTKDAPEPMANDRSMSQHDTTHNSSMMIQRLGSAFQKRIEVKLGDTKNELPA